MQGVVAYLINGNSFSVLYYGFHKYSIMKFLFLSQLTEVNDSMAEYTAGFNLGQPNATQLHTLQRHRDILQGYSHEFSKTKVKSP